MTLRLGKPPSALTLLEVIVSLAIFLFSITAIWQLMFIGSEHATQVSIQARTSMRCQAKMAEVMMGASPLTATSNYAPYDDDPSLQWRVDVGDSGTTNLQLVKVFVKMDLPSGKTVESQLCQFVFDPTLRGSTMDAPVVPDLGAAPPTSDPSSSTPAAGSAAASGGAAAAGGGGGGGAAASGAKTGGAAAGGAGGAGGARTGGATGGGAAAGGGGGGGAAKGGATGGGATGGGAKGGGSTGKGS